MCCICNDRCSSKSLDDVDRYNKPASKNHIQYLFVFWGQKWGTFFLLLNKWLYSIQNVFNINYISVVSCILMRQYFNIPLIWWFWDLINVMNVLCNFSCTLFLSASLFAYLLIRLILILPRSLHIISFFI